MASELDPQPGARVRKISGRRRPEPERVPELAHLSLSVLREHRQALTEEETRVSYWRRILQGRHDLIVTREDPIAHGRLRAVLADHSSASRHLAVQQLDPADAAPPLPELAELWDELDQSDPTLGEQMIIRLDAAEASLSAYRTSLHLRIDAATAELIARYREHPRLALVALPLNRVG